MMCFHKELVGEELGCLDPNDPDFDEKSEDGEEGGAARLGPRGLMGAVVGAGVLMAVM